MDQMPFIPFNLPTIGKEEIDEVTDTLQSGWLTTGPKTARFEQEFRNYVHAPYALAVNSATSGIHQGQVHPGSRTVDHVRVRSVNIIAKFNTILQVGAT